MSFACVILCAVCLSTYRYDNINMNIVIRLHPIYMITGDPHAPLRATRAVLYTPRGDTHAPDMKPP